MHNVLIAVGICVPMTCHSDTTGSWVFKVKYPIQKVILQLFSLCCLDTIATSRSVLATWNLPITRLFTICACYYSGLHLRSPSVTTPVVGAETRTSNSCHMPFT